MKRLRRTLALLLLALPAVFAIMVWAASSRLLSPPRRALQDYHKEILNNAAAHGMRIESYTTKDTPCLLCEPISAPGPALKGNKLRSELTALGCNLAPWGQITATLVLLHGHTGCKEDHLPVAERFCAAGFRCILIDLPGHGTHPAPMATFGKTEHHLPSEALAFAATRYGFNPAPAALFGISQGGAISLQSASLEGNPWRAVAALSSFSSLDRVVEQQARAWFGPLAPLAQSCVEHLIQWGAGYTPSSIRPIDAAAKLHLPVLIGHGEADRFVTPDQAQALLRAVPAPTRQFLNIPGAGHSTVLTTTAPVYSTVSQFFIKSLSPP